jgi:hypothetical protein
MIVCDSPSTMTYTMPTLDSKGLALNKANTVTFSSCDILNFNIQISCLLHRGCVLFNPKSDLFSFEQDYLAILEAIY